MASVPLSHANLLPPPSKAIKKNYYEGNLSNRSRTRHRAAASCSSTNVSWASELDLYELLGVKSSSDQAEIKKAYRALQKRCHPDIAGPAGHDMAILLNDVYSVLSDPVARYGYDKEQAKISEFQGYTGKPIYSTWFGSENEQRAVFVDELKCVGCLKCALFAKKTFAVESAFGRARVVAQWADPEDKILDAIQTCPVDCISIVERSNLAALEFLMSKQPRGTVRISGARASNIFAAVTKFQNRYREIQERTSTKQSKDSDLRRESRFSAFQGIRSISSKWWYWRPPGAETSEEETSIVLSSANSTITDVERLRKAAARYKNKTIERLEGEDSTTSERSDEYWKPMTFLPPPSGPETPNSTWKPPSDAVFEKEEEEENTAGGGGNTVDLRTPLVMAAISAASVAFRGREVVETQGGGVLQEHIAGSMALEVVNSFELQIALAGATWFVIGMGVHLMVDAIVNKKDLEDEKA
ncbi:chaperone protein dnaJ C76, chloroplastic-like [Zingiber officinale]|uniref:chaperone protein dnaJ C76, chloroplastic-like n=1 Tax=Zingiber officinale TaxID=94328 RepID=UPI001C4C3281|nr:chaperone protein dnaJ C76, chloroplastic-like [Zingiber officinale]